VHAALACDSAAMALHQRSHWRGRLGADHAAGIRLALDLAGAIGGAGSEAGRHSSNARRCAPC
jgi:hypothetical protein